MLATLAQPLEGGLRFQGGANAPPPPPKRNPDEGRQSSHGRLADMHSGRLSVSLSGGGRVRKLLPTIPASFPSVETWTSVVSRCSEGSNFCGRLFAGPRSAFQIHSFLH